MAEHSVSFTDKYSRIEHTGKRFSKLITHNEFRSDRIPMAGYSISSTNEYIAVEYFRKRYNK